MRPARLLPFLLLVALNAWAQSGKPADLQPLPAVPPPPPGMEAFDAALEAEPQVTIVKLKEETREEYRVNGRLYMIKVTPAVGPSFYLVDFQGQGNFVQADTVGPVTKPPMWVIHRW
ncbi:MAG TPA: DUF2782 domain-containing protein [Rhodocyclaceae bacterium]|nr:DUF2782 domain-containing protein [Rhodocyclaceae bacterium]